MTYEYYSKKIIFACLFQYTVDWNSLVHVYTMYRVEGVWSSTVLENGLTIKVSLISSKDVRLPVQLQRAVAAEAEAAREARAKVR